MQSTPTGDLAHGVKEEDVAVQTENRSQQTCSWYQARTLCSFPSSVSAQMIQRDKVRKTLIHSRY